MKARLARWWDDVDRDASPRAMVGFLCDRLRTYSLGTAGGLALGILMNYLERH